MKRAGRRNEGDTDRVKERDRKTVREIDKNSKINEVPGERRGGISTEGGRGVQVEGRRSLTRERKARKFTVAGRRGETRGWSSRRRLGWGDGRGKVG